MNISKLHQIENGFSLIEVLVTLLILAIGLLSIAAMQLKGLQYNHDAYMRSQVNVLSYDIADRMRLNRGNVANYVSNYTVPANMPAGCVVATGADAVNDLACWRLTLFNTIPPGSVADVSVNAGSPNMYDITINWTDREGSNRAVQYTFQP
jgi:type IV pilus assembly protein PilV